LVDKTYNQMSPLKRSLVNALIGFLVYGGWGVLVNLMHGQDPAIKAGLVQGSYSFVLTFIMTMLMESVFGYLYNLSKHDILSASGTVVLTCGLVFSGSWFVNYLADTPEIFNTVILGYVLGGLYSLFYVVVLVQQRRTDKTKR